MIRKILVVIVNYRTPTLVVDCLKSLFVSEPSQSFSFHAVVVDNGSEDDSVGLIRAIADDEKWRGQVSIIRLETNSGFARGNNIGAAWGVRVHNPEFIWLLNPDTVVRPGACRELVSSMDRHAVAGVAGSQLEDPDTTIQIAAFRDHTVIGEMLAGFQLGVLAHWFRHWVVADSRHWTQDHRADWVAGASMIIRVQLWERLHGLDERFFLYYEEVDFCARARAAGWECWHAPRSRVVHLVGAATGISNHRKAQRRRPAYWYSSRRSYFLKQRGALALVLADSLFLIGRFLYELRKRPGASRVTEPPHFLRDFFRSSVYLRGYSR